MVTQRTSPAATDVTLLRRPARARSTVTSPVPRQPRPICAMLAGRTLHGYGPPMLRRVTSYALGALALVAILSLGAEPSGALTTTERAAWVPMLTALRSNNFPAAYAAAASDPLATKYVRWADYSRPGSGARFEDIVAFLDNNPDWPGQLALRQRAEDAIAGVSDDALQRWFLGAGDHRSMGFFCIGSLFQPPETDRNNVKRLHSKYF